MADYYCLECGGRTSMMGHANRHDKNLLSIVDKVVEQTGARRDKVVEAVGLWQIGEKELPYEV